MKRLRESTPAERAEALETYLALRDSAPRDEAAVTRARNAVAVAHLSLVRYVAARYARPGRHVHVDDLAQAGHIGLLKAIDRYEPEKAIFATYAFMIIRSEIHAALGLEHEVRLPDHVRHNLARLARLEFSRTGERVDVEACADALGLSQERVDALRRAPPARAASLDAERDDSEGSTLHDLLESEHESPYAAAERHERETIVRDISATLPSRERRVLERLLDDDPMAVIGAALGVTRQRAAQIGHHALWLLRREAVARGLGRAP